METLESWSDFPKVTQLSLRLVDSKTNLMTNLLTAHECF